MKKKKLMKKQSYFVVLLMLLLLFPSGAFAQQQMIKGQVVDDKGDTVIGATVMLKGTQEFLYKRKSWKHIDYLLCRFFSARSKGDKTGR